MNETQVITNPKIGKLEELFNRAKPKSRYISQSHIQQQSNTIAKEIINGDIKIPRNKVNFDKNEKKSYEDILRRRYIDQIQKQKQQLEHKLGYIQNSLSSFEKYNYLRRKSSSQQENVSMIHPKTQEWRRQFQDQMKKIQEKKKLIQEKSKEKDLQTEQIRNKIKQQQKKKHQAEIQESIKKIKERTEKRQIVLMEQKERLKELLNKKELYQKMQQKFQEKQENVLQERKKKLAELRQLKTPINYQQILQHQKQVLQLLKQKQQQRNIEKKMNSSRTQSYRPSYKSSYYKQLLHADKQEQNQDSPKEKIQKMRQFSQVVRNKYIPDIDENKRREMEQKIERQQRVRLQRLQKQKELIQKPKLKGLEYLQLVKNLPKKDKNIPATAPKSQRIEYKNYLGNLSVDLQKVNRPWKKILNKGDHKIQTALFLQYQSQKLQQKLKMKQEYGRVMKQKDDGSIDQEYYEMVKAKLQLLSKE